MTRTHDRSTSPRLALAAAAALVATLASASAAAQANFTGEYARKSVSLLAGGAMTFDAPLRNGSSAFSLTLGATPRIVIQHIVIQPTFGFGYASSGRVDQVAFVAGVGVGYALVLSERLALSPMGVFDIAYGSASVGGFGSANSTSGRFYGEVPLTIFVGASGFFEPYADVGFAVPFSSGESAFFFTIGYRLGVTF